MRFTVPQFIEHEAKIVGPFTFRQFVFIAIAGAISFFVYTIAPFFVFVIVAVFSGGIALALAFLQINGRSLPMVISSFFRFNLAPKMYLWKKSTIQIKVFEKESLSVKESKG